LVFSTTSGFLRLNRNPFIDGLLSSRQSHRVRTRRGAISTFKGKRQMSTGNYHRGQRSPTMAAFASSTATSRRRGEGRHAAGAPQRRAPTSQDTPWPQLIPIPGSACETSSWSRRENGLRRNYRCRSSIPALGVDYDCLAASRLARYSRSPSSIGLKVSYLDSASELSFDLAFANLAVKFTAALATK
jgi:hypothetical protein